MVTWIQRIGLEFAIWLIFNNYKSDYCRIIWHAYFGRQSEWRIAVFRIYSGGEYYNVDLFFKETVIARQVSEARIQDSDGTSERMHRTILNMTRRWILRQDCHFHSGAMWLSTLLTSWIGVVRVQSQGKCLPRGSDEKFTRHALHCCLIFMYSAVWRKKELVRT